MDVWERLVATTMLGTERQPVDLAADGPLGAVLAKLEGLDEEHKLLGAAAAVSLYRRVGSSPATDAGELPDPVQEEPLHPCPPRAREQLAVMLTGQQNELLPEWLDLLAQSGASLPEEALLAMLNLGNLRPVAAAMAGAWMQWLARKNPDWFFITNADVPDDIAWESAILKRIALLIALRRQDRAQARTFLADVWDTTDVVMREILLAMLAIGMRKDDEPFLESALDDKWKEVRSTAADLLARLPHSHLIQRMRERLEPLLAYTPAQPACPSSPSIMSQACLNVTLPMACDKSMQRDGIQVKVPANLKHHLRNTGQKAWWLLQMVSYIPPGEWCARWGQSPDELIKLVHGHEWQDVFQNGWVQATMRFRDQEWARALWPLVLARQTALGSWTALMALLPPAELEEMTIKALQGRQENQDVLPPLLDLLRFYPCPWSRQLAFVVRKRLQELLASPDTFKENNRSGNGELLDVCLYYFPICAPVELLHEMATMLQPAEQQIPESPYQEYRSKMFKKTTSRL
ncbi:MAG: DUF5691 domain-containing protein [Armatimonadota bacterium]